jgi:hypothetical protein
MTAPSHKEFSMMRFRNLLPLALAALVGAATLGAPAPARAAFEILVFVDGVQETLDLPVTGTSKAFGVLGATTSDGLFTLSLSALATNYSGTPSAALMSNNSNISVIQNFSESMPHTLTVVISENGWTAPASAPLILSSSAGGAIGSTGGAFDLTATNQGFVDTSNALAGLNPGGTSTPIANASASISGTGTASLVYTPSPSTNTAPGGVPFTLTQVFTFTSSNAGTIGNSVNISGSVSVSAVPEPSSLLSALAGVPVLGMGVWVRRRRRSV